jgi:hypothetical protein
MMLVTQYLKDFAQSGKGWFLTAFLLSLIWKDR